MVDVPGFVPLLIARLSEKKWGKSCSLSGCWTPDVLDKPKAGCFYLVVSHDITAEIYHHNVQPGEPNAFLCNSAYVGSRGKGAP